MTEETMKTFRDYLVPLLGKRAKCCILCGKRIWWELDVYPVPMLGYAHNECVMDLFYTSFGAFIERVKDMRRKQNAETHE